MSGYLGSPFHSYLPAYEEDYDDRYEEDEEREHEEAREESDEDTEEASETDIGQHEEPLEIKEQMYQDKLAMLKKKLQQLQDGTHHEYNRKVRVCLQFERFF